MQLKDLQRDGLDFDLELWLRYGWILVGLVKETLSFYNLAFDSIKDIKWRRPLCLLRMCY